MSQAYTLRLLEVLLVAGLGYLAWRIVVIFRGSRRARKSYEKLTEKEQAALEQDPIAAAYSKPLATGSAFAIVVGGALLAAVLIYITHHLTGH
jgi:uncharacterized membrane protein